MYDNSGITQNDTTPLYKEVPIAITMVNESRYMQQTRHMDIKYFALLDWIVSDQLIIMPISINDDPVDGLFKSRGPHILAFHSITLSGKRKYTYYNFDIPTKKSS